MRKSLALLLVSLFIPSFAAAQTLFAVNNFGSGGGVRISSVDPSTGATVVVVEVPGVSFNASTVAFDSIQQRLFFMTPSELYVVNTASGAVSHVPSQVAFDLEFDPVSGLLYGLVNESGQVVVWSIDPTTGNRTRAAAVPAATYPSTAAALDPVNGLFYFFSTSGQLFNVSIRTGAFSSVAASSLLEVHYDSITGRLHGLASAGGFVEVRTVDPATGTVTAVFPTSASAHTLWSSAYDMAGRRFFFISSSSQLYTVNVSTGTFLAVPISAPLELVFADGPTGVAIPLFSPRFQIAMIVGLMAFALTRLQQ
jgi:outer membrane protein assembly factor BamB